MRGRGLASEKAQARGTLTLSNGLTAWLAVVPVVGFWVAGAHGPELAASWSALAAPAAGLVAGGLWQALDRREVLHQLNLAAYAAVFAALVTAVLLAMQAPHLTVLVGAFTYLLGVMAGVVAAEDQLRRRDRRRTGQLAP